MRKNLIFNLIGTIAFFILFWINKSSGYVASVVIASPTTFFLVVSPLFLIFYIFNLVSLITWKTTSTQEKVFKIMMLVHIHILTVCNLLAAQIYVAVGSNLQLTIEIYVYVMCLVFIALYTTQLFTNRKIKLKA